MDFELNLEQRQIQETAEKFAKNVIRPVVTKYDESSEFPLPVLQQAWELGLLNTCIPEEFGGVGFQTIDAVTIIRKMAWGCMGITTAMMANDLALLPIVLGGSTDQKRKYLTPFTEKLKIASFCLTEPEHGSDAGGIKTILKEDGEGYLLSGEKMWITNAGHADLFVVYATTNPQDRYKAITAVVVEKGQPGIILGKKEDKMGHRCSDTRSIKFENVKIKKDQIIGGLHQGWKLAMKTLDHSRPLVACAALGGAEAAFDHAVDYALDRKQFGVEIAQHQMIQSMIAKMAIKIESARLLTYKAAWLLDQGLPNTEIASMAKFFASESCMEIATDAVQIHGGYGYSKEYPVEKIMRDAKLMQIYEGTSQIQQMVIAREIYKKKSK